MRIVTLIPCEKKLDSLQLTAYGA